jgi:hypothetical protein
MLPLTLLIKEDRASAKPRGPGFGTLGRDGGDCGVRAPGEPTDSDDSLEAEPRRLVGEIKLAIRPRRGVGVPRTTSEPCRGDLGGWLCAVSALGNPGSLATGLWRSEGATVLGDMGDIKLAVRPRRGVGVPRTVMEDRVDPKALQQRSVLPNGNSASLTPEEG